MCCDEKRWKINVITLVTALLIVVKNGSWWGGPQYAGRLRWSNCSSTSKRVTWGCGCIWSGCLIDTCVLEVFCQSWRRIQVDPEQGGGPSPLLPASSPSADPAQLFSIVGTYFKGSTSPIQMRTVQKWFDWQLTAFTDWPMINVIANSKQYFSYTIGPMDIPSAITKLHSVEECNYKINLKKCARSACINFWSRIMVILQLVSLKNEAAMKKREAVQLWSAFCQRYSFVLLVWNWRTI